MEQKPQKEFPLLEEYQKKFKITLQTIFAYSPYIYHNYALSKDLIIHEQTHIKRQNEQGLDIWVHNYLNDDEFRLKEEIIAYLAQIWSIKDRNLRLKVRVRSAKDLSSALYGNIITYEEAFDILK